MDTEKTPHKWVIALKEWVFPIIISIFTIMIGPLLYEYFVTVRPRLKNIDDAISEINMNLKKIESKYITTDAEGLYCKVGNSKDFIGATAYIYNNKNKSLGLKNGDVILVSNPYNMYRPSIWCTVCLLDPNGDSDNGIADMYLSKEALERLGIKNVKSVFPMYFKTKTEMEDLLNIRNLYNDNPNNS